MGRTKSTARSNAARDGRFNSSDNRLKYSAAEPEEEEEDDDDESSYEVQAIMDKKVEDNMNHYLVSWKGYPKDQATWQPISNLNNCAALICEYEMKHLRENDKAELTYGTQFYQPDAQITIEDTYTPLPQDIYSYNLQILGNGESTITQLQRISLDLNKQLKENMPISAQLISIIGFQPNDPEHLRVRARTQSQTRTYRVSKSRLQREHTQALISYYQSLIEWD